jgi:hypothetical protein
MYCLWISCKVLKKNTKQNNIHVDNRWSLKNISESRQKYSQIFQNKLKESLKNNRNNGRILELEKQIEISNRGKKEYLKRGQTK